MKIEFVDRKEKTKPSFKAGDIIALKEEYNGLRTGKTDYYLLGFYNDQYYYLSNIETGTLAEDNGITLIGKTEYSKEELTDVIEHYDGRVYSETKLIIEEYK